MKSTNLKSFLRLSPLIIIGVSCAVIIYMYLSYTNIEEKSSSLSENIILKPEKLTDEKCTPLCDTKECISYAAILLKRMDLTTDPCDNFDLFLCGGFKKRLAVEEVSTILDVLTNAELIKLTDILDNIKAEPESASGKMKTLYDSCISISSELQAVERFQTFLNELGIINWPNLAPDFQFAGTNLPTILGKLMVYFDFLFRFGTSREKKDGRTEMLIRVDFLDPVDNPMLHISSKALSHILNYFDLNSDEADTIKMDFTTFRNALMSIPKEECEENCTEEKVDCLENIPDEWKQFCEFTNAYFNSQKNELIGKYTISISRSYVASIKNFFSTMNELPDRIIANFIAIGVLFENIEELNSYFQETKLKYFLTINDWVVKEEDRSRFCATWVSKNLHPVLFDDFSSQYLNASSVDEIVEIFNDYRSTVIDLVVSQDWIPTEKKSFIENFIGKADSNFHVLKNLLGNETYFKTALSVFTENLRFSNEDFFDNVLQMKRHKREFFRTLNEEYILFIEAYDMMTFAVGGSSLVGASVSIIQLGFGLFFLPYYLPALSNDINRIQLVQLVGHEFGHWVPGAIAFGAQNFPNLHETYLKKEQCVEKQFSKFKLSLLNERLNGSRYAVENMADSTAVSLLDKMAERYNISGIEFLLPGLPYSTKQLFYMIGNQFWCAKENLKSETRYAVYDSHAPLEFRLTGMMQNSREFSKAFDCPVGSYMNPSQKCSLLD